MNWEPKIINTEYGEIALWPIDEGYGCDKEGNVYSWIGSGYKTPDYSRKPKVLAKFVSNSSESRRNNSRFLPYLTVHCKSKRKAVHRMMLQCWTPEWAWDEQVNHVDENPMNNRLENLEWCNARWNISWSRGTPVDLYDMECTWLGHFPNATVAAEYVGIDHRSFFFTYGDSVKAQGYIMCANGASPLNAVNTKTEGYRIKRREYFA